MHKICIFQAMHMCKKNSTCIESFCTNRQNMCKNMQNVHYIIFINHLGKLAFVPGRLGGLGTRLDRDLRLECVWNTSERPPPSQPGPSVSGSPGLDSGH